MYDTEHMTTTVTLKYGKGGYRGVLGNRAWLAKISGLSDLYKVERQFLDANRVECEHPGRTRTIVRLTWELGEGLYERSEGGVREWGIVSRMTDGGCEWLHCDEARAMRIAHMMDQGIDFTAARRASKDAVHA